ncbi:hypothetical protein JZ751_021841 [Albula glossodonta]|uniref:Acid sphingomyelinase-like phosphodiesterase n=1 Tax=Albula glossodonta TaxID=121402 RepID=A0A8T2MRX9_9TELE|nr:hypothetical protein JZ751_008523 [Albula glossodonta]KAG9330854.1 hypothetical protein JZ751_021841 [Albula glossodonta]
MFVIRASHILCIVFCSQSFASLGTFWHITDLHWDPTYTVTDNPEGVCASNGARPVTNAGKFGHYLCDSPWNLINSSIYAMKDILPDPDFIVWTGDDTPHVPNEQLGVEAVVSIIGNITQIIKQVFPDTKVYSALGNHDYHPKSQLPPGPNSIYEQTTQLWQDWLEPESLHTFRAGGFYTERLLNRTGFRVLVLNTNLYYDQNNHTKNMDDPAGQFSWADDILTSAASNNEKVYIVGHVPPGFFEKKRHKPWFRPNFNRRYLDLVQRHHAVIAGQFFGHHHTDTFRMFKDSKGTPINVMFLTPGVTPWKTTLPGVADGANNPGIRDMVTYYLNLTHANVVRARWEKEYRLTEAFQVPDASAASMHRVLERMATDHCHLQRYYDYNSVSYDLSPCDQACRADHVCSIREVDFDRYEICMKEEDAPSKGHALTPLLLSTALGLLVAFF